jgi:protein SCO1/2
MKVSITKAFLLIYTAFFIASSVSAMVVWFKMRSGWSLPVMGDVPQFVFTESRGTPFGCDQLRGKISVVDFIFTRCRSVCPVMGENMGELYRLYAKSPAVQYVSISVEPEYDSLSVLRDYADRMGVTDNRWKWLRGDINDVVQLSERGFLLAADQLPAGHSSKFILVDDRARIRGYYSGVDEKDVRQLERDIRRLLAAMK